MRVLAACLLVAATGLVACGQAEATFETMAADRVVGTGPSENATPQATPTPQATSTTQANPAPRTAVNLPSGLVDLKGVKPPVNSQDRVVKTGETSSANGVTGWYLVLETGSSSRVKDYKSWLESQGWKIGKNNTTSLRATRVGSRKEAVSVSAVADSMAAANGADDEEPVVVAFYYAVTP